MSDRDPFTEIFELKERAEEDIFFARRDRELIEQLRQAKEEARLRRLQKLTRSRCPDCGRFLERQSLHGMDVDACPACHGAWLATEQLAALSERKAPRWARDFLSNLMHLVAPIGLI